MRTTREKLVDDFAEMLTEAEDLMKRAASETGDRAKDLRSQVEAKLLAARSRLQEMQGDALDSASAAARFFNSALALAHTRAELASVEFAEERARLKRTAMMIAGAVFMLSFAVLGVATWVVVYFWDTHR